MSGARQSFDQAAHWGHTFDARFALANLAFLQGDMPTFLQEIRRALAIAPANRVRMVLTQALHVTGARPQALVALLPPRRPAVDLAATNFFLDQGGLRPAAAAWRMVTCGAIAIQRSCGLTLQRLLDQWVGRAYQDQGEASRGDVELALQLWNQAVASGMLAQPRASWGSFPDGDLRWNFFGPSFSWNDDTPALGVRTEPEASSATGRALLLSFTGDEPETLAILHHFLPVEAGASYQLTFRSRRTGSGTATGLMVQVLGGQGKPAAAVNVQLASQWRQNRLVFAVPPNLWLVKMVVAYQRPLGQVRLRDPVQLDDFQLRPQEAAPRG